ncbi:MAG TPA: hypothetical protein PLT48_16110 [Nitrospira sp.]|nr:hypothetical protein [Nitrospira sp.]HNB42678.1 hypothetical protein [Burkholderiaceae bacterium]HNG78835.1 hypothetical protein [Burkholderiaceae bacterium]
MQLLLCIRLRDGFFNDTVAVRVNGSEVYKKHGVTTDLSISFADAIEFTVEKNVIMLEVSVDGRPGGGPGNMHGGGLHESKEIWVQQTPFVDVWLIQGRLELRASSEEVPML